MKINDQIAIVTGGDSGLGRATACYLIAQGAKVVVWDRQHQSAPLEGAYTLACDVSQEQSVKEALAETLEKVGQPRCLVQCAGIIKSARMVGKEGPMPLADFTKVIDVNLIGTFNVMRLVAETMASSALPEGEEERGVIINTASIAAFEGQIGQTAYSASKAGVVAMTLPAARELAKMAIRVNTIAPGLMETPMLLTMPPALQDNLKQACVFPARLGRGEEFAKLVAHVIENSLINGEVIRLDGAIRLQAK